MPFKASELWSIGGCGCDGPSTNGPLVTGLEDALIAACIVLRWNWVMRLCTLDSVLKLGQSRIALVASLFPSYLIVMSKQIPFYLLAGVFARGDEAKCGWGLI